MPEATKNSHGGGLIQMADDDQYTHLIHARGCKEQGHGKLETVGLFWMMDDSYAPYPCQRLQRPKSWETGDCWIILDEG